jgi:hypothetical protein
MNKELRPFWAFVVYVDISGWSLGDATQQKEQMVRLLEYTKKHLSELKTQGIKPFWLTTTGDGWAIVFKTENPLPIMEFAIKVYEDVLQKERFKIRVGVSSGTLINYSNSLMKRRDVCGPAIIIARRLVEGAMEGEFLIDEHLAKQLIGINASWSSHITPASPIRDKHGNVLNTRRYVSSIKTKDYVELKKREKIDHVGLLELLNIAKKLGHGPNREILRLEELLKTKLCGIDGLLILWIDGKFEGLSADSVYIDPSWDKYKVKSTGIPKETLGSPDERFLELISNIIPKYHAEIRDAQNRPKVWVRNIKYPLTDRPYLSLELGGLDYRTNRALEEAFSTPVKQGKTLSELYEEGYFDILTDLPNMVVIHIVMKTRDGYLVLAQRGRKQVDYASGKFSPSCEEQWDPSKDQYPHETVLRCLAEEWNIESSYGVPVTSRHIKLLAIGREWGTYWNTAFIYAVDLPCDSKDVLDLWTAVPEDKAEASGIGVIPMGERDGRYAIIKMLQENKVRRSFLSTYGAKWAGVVRDERLHETTGAARVLLSLAHWYGLDDLSNLTRQIKQDA